MNKMHHKYWSASGGYLYTGSGRKTWWFFKLKLNEKNTIFLREFITKIIFISKNFNYNIHFLNIVSVRWRPCQHIPASVSESSASLVAACWEKLLPLLPWCSVSSPPLSLVSFRTACSWDIPRGSTAARDTRSDEYWSADEISTESQRQNRCF